MEKSVCFMCGEGTELRCQDCEWGPHYCRPHLRFHRENDAEPCFPYSIVEREDVGRCLVASRKIPAGETLFWESSPLALAPAADAARQCLGCRRKICEEESTLCPGCSWPMCGSRCADQHRDSPECRLLDALRDSRRADVEEATFYEPVLAVRMLMLRFQDPSSYKLALRLMDHGADRRSDAQHWSRTQRDVCIPIKDAFIKSGIWSDADLDEITRVVGIVEVNCYEITNRTGDCGVRGVYPVTSLLSHSCAPNARLAMAPGGACLNRCVASVDIEKGEEITITYLPLHMDLLTRRAKLKDDWYFECCCKRCQDPTEMGTYLSGVKCLESECQKSGSILLPKEPLNFESEWACKACSKSVVGNGIRTLVEDLMEEKTALKRSDLDGYFDFLDKAGRLLHENHYVLNSARRWIVPLFCRPLSSNNDGEPFQVTDKMLERKVKMCSKYLSVLDVIEKGLTKNRGRILYELAETSLTLKYSHYRQGLMAESDFVKDLKSCRETLQEVMACLRFDDAETFEGYIFRSSQALSKNVEAMLHSIC